MKKNYLISFLLLLFVTIIGTKTQAQVIYGTTPSGGVYSSGVLFKYTAGPNITTLFNFGIANGAKAGMLNPPEVPTGNLVEGTNGIFYGTSQYGGDNYEGTIYSYNPVDDSVHILVNFDYNSGSPSGGLLQMPSGILYGSTASGGMNYIGTLFSYNPAIPNSFNAFHDMTYAEGGQVQNGFTLHSDGMLYCVANTNGTNGHGAIIKVNPSNNAVSAHFDFDTIYGFNVYGKLFSYNGKLYGLAENGGANMSGTLFEYNPVTDTIVVLFNFSAAKGGTGGKYPYGGVIQVNGDLYGTARQGGVNNDGVLFKYDLTGGTYTAIIEFDSLLTGKNPSGTLSLSNDGWLYGTCYEGGAFNKGTFFKYHPITQTFVKLVDFNGLNGFSPMVNTPIETIDLTFSASDTVMTAPPFNIQFTNNTPSPSKYIWQWQFGDGAVSYQKNPSHTYTNNGSYTVTLIALDTVNHRYDTLQKQQYITLSGAAACPVVANVSPSGFIYMCPGDSVLLHATSVSSSNTYQWLRTGIYLNGATDSTFWAKQSGYYQVRVSNGNCWNFSNVAFVQAYPVEPPIIHSMGFIQPCSNDSMKLFLYQSPGNLQWSTGDTTDFIFVNKSGFYTVTTGDNNGCNVTSPDFVVNAALVDAPELCIVGVDSVSGHNVIVWNQTTDVRIDSFRVYKEGLIHNQFILLGAKARSETAMLIDMSSDPRKMAYRYRLMAVDSCGKETPVGPFHKTIHLQVNVGINGTWNLHWNPYEGTTLGTYYVYRGTDSTQMSLLATLPTSVHSFTDLNPPSGNVYYLLKVDLPAACNPGGGTTYNLSSSNFFNTKDATVGVEEIKMHDISLSVFPNPNNGIFTIKMSSESQQRMSISIFNNLGSLVASEQIEINGTISKNINLSHLSKGVYFIQMQTTNDVVVRKVIIQ